MEALENFIMDNFVSDPARFAEQLEWLFIPFGKDIVTAPIFAVPCYLIMAGALLGINAWYSRYLASLTPEEREAERENVRRGGRK